MRDAEVEDQAPAASLVSQVVPNLHDAAPLACACRDPMLGADSVPSRVEERPKHSHEPVCALVAPTNQSAPWSENADNSTFLALIVDACREGFKPATALKMLIGKLFPQHTK